MGNLIRAEFYRLRRRPHSVLGMALILLLGVSLLTVSCALPPQVGSAATLLQSISTLSVSGMFFAVWCAAAASSGVNKLDILKHEAVFGIPRWQIYLSRLATACLLGVGLVITLFQLPMSTFIMRNAFDAIPKDMEEAAMVDGCNSLQALFKILVPVVKPSMVTVGLLAFLEAWNNFMIPLYLSSSSKSTLPLALVNMRQQTMGVIDYGATEAGVVILLIPCAILFLALQKYYVKGFMAGAVKG